MVKTVPRSTQLEVRVGYGNEKVGEKHRFCDACDTGGCGTVSTQGPFGERGGVGTRNSLTRRRQRPSTIRVTLKVNMVGRSSSSTTAKEISTSNETG